MEWLFDNDRPIYAQIIGYMKLYIVSGKLAPGTKLASVRELAAEAGVNPNTMQKALSELENTGLVFSNRTSGRLVTDDAQLIQRVKDEIARNNIKIFLENMSKIGIDTRQSIQLLQKTDIGGTDNG